MKATILASMISIAMNNGFLTEDRKLVIAGIEVELYQNKDGRYRITSSYRNVQVSASEIEIPSFLNDGEWALADMCERLFNEIMKEYGGYSDSIEEVL